MGLLIYSSKSNLSPSKGYNQNEDLNAKQSTLLTLVNRGFQLIVNHAVSGNILKAGGSPRCGAEWRRQLTNSIINSLSLFLGAPLPLATVAEIQIGFA